MNPKKLEIQIYEGFAGASLIALLVTSFQSFMNFKKFLDFKYEKPVEIDLIQYNLNKPIQIQAKIHSSSDEIFKFNHSIQYAYLDYQNFETSISFEKFHIDSQKTVEIVPVSETKWITTHYYQESSLFSLSKLFYFLTVPFHLFRYFFGLRFKNGEYTSESCLKPGDSVFIYGVASLIEGKVQVIPKTISVSKNSITQMFFDSFKRSFLPVAIPAAILAFSYIQICKLMTPSRGKEKVQAVSHMVCVICKSKPVEVLLEPCYHLCLCQTCARTISSCPMCDSSKQAVVRVYR